MMTTCADCRVKDCCWFGRQYHTAELKNIEEARTVYKIIQVIGGNADE